MGQKVTIHSRASIILPLFLCDCSVFIILSFSVEEAENRNGYFSLFQHLQLIFLLLT